MAKDSQAGLGDELFGTPMAAARHWVGPVHTLQGAVDEAIALIRKKQVESEARRRGEAERQPEYESQGDEAIQPQHSGAGRR